MTVVFTGGDLSLEDVLRRAPGTACVEIDRAVVTKMLATRGVVERPLDRGGDVYALTTGIGAAKRYKVEPEQFDQFSRMMALAYGVGQDPGKSCARPLEPFNARRCPNSKQHSGFRPPWSDP